MPAKAKKKKNATKNKKKKETLSTVKIKGVVKKVEKSKKKKGWKKEKRKQYSHESLEKALQAVNKGMSYRKAAEMFGVPPTSLHRTVKNPHKLKSKSSPSTVLPANIEQDIINWILYRAERGNPATKTELLDSVQNYIQLEGTKTPFNNDRPGRHWYEKFRKRHPEITLRTPQHLSMIRASVTEEDIRGWFEEIGSHLKNKNLLSIHASRVFNCDETNIQFVPKSDKVLTETGARNSYKIFDGCEKESLTALFMYSADGTRAPPMIMFKYKEVVPSNILKKCPVGWGIGNSENGWMTTETFYEYITNVFYPWLVKKNIEFPIIVYLDGHSSHVTIPLVSFCKERQIELIALFPNATHIMQPLDIALFHPFKDLWRKTVMKWKVENKISKLKKEHIPVVLEEALNSFDNEKQIIQNGFKATGLMPFNPNAIEYNVLHKKKKTKKKDQVDQQLQNQKSDCQETESMKQHLLTFEKNLSDDVLQTFKEAEASGKWDQGIEKFALFQYWLDIKKAASGT
ncbi:Uncharacterized protein DBV15_11450 [Temnothorax longispinosus]|uniref:HTH CENPB-type domain-containing protein n=1 Tax=Temnothorax longispinosus TaxID=300112 RepID=A0A4S2KN07_9HYME|nr:Uncharacterized protein DBV15_11450 [Temnothorax longispinosus]